MYEKLFLNFFKNAWSGHFCPTSLVAYLLYELPLWYIHTISALIRSWKTKLNAGAFDIERTEPACEELKTRTSFLGLCF